MLNLLIFYHVETSQRSAKTFILLIVEELNVNSRPDLLFSLFPAVLR
jgi:hypothetical protein